MYVLACIHNVDITMPPIIRKRGRPKGHEMIVIELPAKKANKGGGDSAANKEKLVLFIKLHTSLKEKGLFSLSLSLSLSFIHTVMSLGV